MTASLYLKHYPDGWRLIEREHTMAETWYDPICVVPNKLVDGLIASRIPYIAFPANMVAMNTNAKPSKLIIRRNENITDLKKPWTLVVVQDDVEYPLGNFKDFPDCVYDYAKGPSQKEQHYLSRDNTQAEVFDAMEKLKQLRKTLKKQNAQLNALYEKST